MLTQRRRVDENRCRPVADISGYSRTRRKCTRRQFASSPPYDSGPHVPAQCINHNPNGQINATTDFSQATTNTLPTSPDNYELGPRILSFQTPLTTERNRPLAAQRYSNTPTPSLFTHTNKDGLRSKAGGKAMVHGKHAGENYPLPSSRRPSPSRRHWTGASYLLAIIQKASNRVSVKLAVGIGPRICSKSLAIHITIWLHHRRVLTLRRCEATAPTVAAIRFIMTVSRSFHSKEGSNALGGFLTET